MANDDAPGTGSVWIPGARLAGFIKRTTLCITLLHTKYGNSERRRFFVCSIVSLWELMTHGEEPFLTPRACFAGLMLSSTYQ